MEQLATSTDASPNGTNLRNFMANRGAIIIKETKPFGTVNGDYYDSLSIDTMVLRIIRGTDQNDAFGVILTLKSQKGSEETVHLDFDEIDELINALKVIRHTAEEIARTERDYTEVIYATKDNARFGFYQANGTQKGFVNIGFRGNLFHSVHDNASIENLLRNAMEHLRTKGAEVVKR